ncbi:hypothetical protein DXV75_04290 [Alteromonas aestuariivivens]|uniref:Tetratricopeptide repeat protein n=1 Tax=Alteromonas aestuariivivens TaxID=1938339 RepID=A0A3D8MCP2_9ALTE|nr:hypothetical protein [Alteromonas aestuariivivens]RDV28182.1 hypothetical protein DXV75_04290 [Alteromonas aestuariivivens]
MGKLTRFVSRQCCMLLLPAIGLCGTASTVWAETDSEAAMSRIHLGEVVYSLYQDDPLATLTQIAVAQQAGMSEQHAQQAELLGGGLTLAYGMTATAEQQLSALLEDQQSNPEIRSLALYWLSRLNFQQGRYQAASANYQALLSQSPNQDDSVVTDAQWLQLNYQAAYQAILTGADGAAFNAVAEDSAESVYLQYNQAVLSYEQGNLAEAQRQFEHAAARLARLQPASSEAGWLAGWLSWSGETAVMSDKEYQALADRIQLSLGQTLLAREQLSSATRAFSKIQGQSVVQHEALLSYAWSLAQAGDWPMALGIWQYLSQQPENLFTLQAQHALAVGFVQQQGMAQAAQALSALTGRLDQALASLIRLQDTAKDLSYWLMLARQQPGSGDSGDSADAPALWPQEHADLLQQLLTDTPEHSGQQWLSQLTELDRIEALLQAQYTKLGQYALLVDEREQEHLTRIRAMAEQRPETDLNHLKAQMDALEGRLQQARNGAEQEDSLTGLFAHLAVFADDKQRKIIERLAQAKQRFDHLSSAQPMSEDYSRRLERFEGLMFWQLHEAFPARAFELQRAVESLKNEYATTLKQDTRVRTLLNQPDLYNAQRDRVNQHKAEVAAQLAQTRSIQLRLVDALSSRANALLAQRALYLKQQKNHSELALLQLQDPNQENAATVQAGAQP